MKNYKYILKRTYRLFGPDHRVGRLFKIVPKYFRIDLAEF